MHEEKSVDIELYSVSKMQAAFDEATTADEQPAADVIAALKERIIAYLAAGKSIAWVISVLQRGGLDKGARQIRTYLQRAGIGDKAAKRRAGRSVRKSAGQQKGRQTPSTEPAPHAHAEAEAGSRPIGHAAQEAAKPPAPPSAASEAEAVRRPAGQPATKTTPPAPPAPPAPAAPPAAEAGRTPMTMKPKTEAPTERKAPPSQEEWLTAAKEKGTAPQTTFGSQSFGQPDDADDGDPDSLL